MRQRTPQLDLLRGIAVLMVLLCHYQYLDIFRIGWAGVDLFFVLSGFLISGLLFNDWKRNGKISLKRFFVRRAFKIYPAFYFFLITTSIGAMLLVDHPFRKFAAELLFLQDYLPNIWGHTWSLAIEEQFYILLPLLLLLISRLHDPKHPFAVVPAISALLCIACLTMRVARHPVTPFDALSMRLVLHLRADCLFVGVALGYLFHFRESAFRAISGWWMLPIGLAALIPLSFYENSPRFMPYLLSCNIIGFASLVCWVVPRSNIRAPWIERVGIFSYSIYLWHFVFSPFSYSPWLGNRGLLGFAGYLVASIAVGVYMGKIIEIRMLVLRDKFFPANCPTSQATQSHATPLLESTNALSGR